MSTLRRARRFAPALLVLTVAVACGDVSEIHRSREPKIEPTVEQRVQTLPWVRPVYIGAHPFGGPTAYDVDPGECFNGRGDSSEPLHFIRFEDCDAPHVYEAFALLEHPPADLPGRDELRKWAWNECRLAFEEYVGMAYEDSRYAQEPLVPARRGWLTGDRPVTCLLVSDEFPAVMHESARGSAD